jgi:hypothetical protein
MTPAIVDIHIARITHSQCPQCLFTFACGGHFSSRITCALYDTRGNGFWHMTKPISRDILGVPKAATVLEAIATAGDCRGWRKALRHQHRQRQV